MDGIIDIRIALLLLSLLTKSYFAETSVLDPAMYLYPSPPLLPSISGANDKELWTRNSRFTKLLNFGGSTTETKAKRMAPSTTPENESMESAETFWPRLRSIDYALKEVHVPVTFTLTGNYGGYRGSGVIGNTYASIGSSLFGFGKSALAGSSYGNYGSPVRVYGGNEGPAWSGWGNGKWGHYGKG